MVREASATGATGARAATSVGEATAAPRPRSTSRVAGDAPAMVGRRAGTAGGGASRCGTGERVAYTSPQPPEPDRAEARMVPQLRNSPALPDGDLRGHR